MHRFRSSLLPRRRERRILAEGETLAQLAVDSSRRALEMAGIQPQELDLVLLATSSPDDAFGSACQVACRWKELSLACNFYVDLNDYYLK